MRTPEEWIEILSNNRFNDIRIIEQIQAEAWNTAIESVKKNGSIQTNFVKCKVINVGMFIKLDELEKLKKW